MSFIGKAIAEFHVYVDYIDTFKAKIADSLPSVSFVDLDPLDPDLIKDESVLDRIKVAGEKLIVRLQKRQKETPIPSHKRFLAKEIERARNQIASGQYVKPTKAMETDGPPETGIPSKGADTTEDLLL